MCSERPCLKKYGRECLRSTSGLHKTPNIYMKATHIYTHTHIHHIYIHTPHTCIHTCTHTHIHTRMHTYTHVYIYHTCIQTCIHTCIHMPHMYTHMQTHMCTHMYIHIHTCIHRHTDIHTYYGGPFDCPVPCQSHLPLTADPNQGQISYEDLSPSWFHVSTQASGLIFISVKHQVSELGKELF